MLVLYANIIYYLSVAKKFFVMSQKKRLSKHVLVEVSRYVEKKIDK